MDLRVPFPSLTRRQFLIATGAAGLVTVGGAGLMAPATSAQPTTYVETVLAKNPVAYWRLGEAPTGPAIDRTGHGHDGTHIGRATATAPGALVGDTDGAVLLDGRRSYIEVPTHADFSQSTSGEGLTVEAWMRPDVLDFKGDSKEGYIHWLGKGGPTRYEWALRFYSRSAHRPNRMSAYLFNLDGGLGAGAYFEDRLIAGEWIHVAACYDPGSARSGGKPGVSIYKNGEFRLGPSSSGARYDNKLWQIDSSPGTAPVRIGTRDSGRSFTGAIDEVVIYPRVLSAPEILENYRAGKR